MTGGTRRRCGPAPAPLFLNRVFLVPEVRLRPGDERRARRGSGCWRCCEYRLDADWLLSWSANVWLLSTGPKRIRKTLRRCPSPPLRGVPRGSRLSWCRPASGSSCESSSGTASFARPPPTSVCLIRNLLENPLDLNSDSGGEEDFVPSKKDLESGDDDEEEEEEEVPEPDSEEEVVVKKGRRVSSCQTPRPRQRGGASRTPRRTPGKVEEPGVTRRDHVSIVFLPFEELPVPAGSWNATDSQHSQPVTAGPPAGECSGGGQNQVRSTKPRV